MDNNRLDELQSRLGYHFKDITLLEMALTHSSYENELKINKTGNYERLEFLGDAVLELTVSEFLFEGYPEKSEGELTRIRASLVCEPTLANVARGFELPVFIKLGKGEKKNNGAQRDSLLCDVFEAIAGAIYLDGGYAASKKYIQEFLLTDWNKKVLFTDAKSLLQELLQKEGNTALYETVSVDGPANSCVYTERLIIAGEEKMLGKGTSRKAAQQQAAYEYLLLIGYGLGN